MSVNQTITQPPNPIPIKCTLVLPRNCTQDTILLAKKARGMGVGKWIGFGGKVEAGETIDAAAFREFREETGVALEPHQLSKIGLLLFTFENKAGLFLEVHVYETFNVNKLPALCDEFCGEAVWFSRQQIPYKDMWEDFSQWSPCMFRQERFFARFHYGENDTVSRFEIEIVDDDKDPILAPSNWVIELAGWVDSFYFYR